MVERAVAAVVEGAGGDPGLMSSLRKQMADGPSVSGDRVTNMRST